MIEKGGAAGQARCRSATLHPGLQLACVCKRGVKSRSKRILTLAPGR